MFSIQVKAQYLQFEPIPYVPEPEPPAYNPPSYSIPPPPQYLPAPGTMMNATPTISIISKYLIKVAKINGQDYTQHYISVNAGIAMYIFNNEPAPYMAILMPGDNSNSNGQMLAITNEETPQTSTTYGRTTSTFGWEFTNSADGKKGSATVTFIKEYRPDVTVFLCHIEATNGMVCDFQGRLFH